MFLQPRKTKYKKKEVPKNLSVEKKLEILEENYDESEFGSVVTNPFSTRGPRPLDVADETTLTQRLLDFQGYYQEVARSFSWGFAPADLKRRLEAAQALSLHLAIAQKLLKSSQLV